MAFDMNGFADPLLGVTLGARGRAAALRAEPEEWLAAALADLRAYALEHGPFTAEQFRIHWLTQGDPAPRTHQVWGALMREAQRLGVIEPTGRYKRAASPATHGHPVAIWRAVTR